MRREFSFLKLFQRNVVREFIQGYEKSETENMKIIEFQVDLKGFRD